MKTRYITVAEREYLLDSFKNVNELEKESFITMWSRNYNIRVASIREYLQSQNLYQIQQPKKYVKKIKWFDDEVEFLKEFAEFLPIEMIVKKIQSINRKHKIKPRTRTAIERKIHLLGLRTSCEGEYYSVTEISKLLGMSECTLRRWIKDDEKVRKILKITGGKQKFRIHRKNIAKFCVFYRSELGNFNVDLVWLLSLFEK
jgi:AraC-like DNA-binding protein